MITFLEVLKKSDTESADMTQGNRATLKRLSSEVNYGVILC
jgi:hypothetical protein